MAILKLLIYKYKRMHHFFKTGLLSGLRGQLVYKFPNKGITTIAITGTDGKTSSTTLLYHILKTAGLPVAMLSTVAAYIGDEAIDTGFHVTSPQPYDLYKFMDKMRTKGLTYLVLEVTSQGEYQHRVWGILPHIAGLTNIDKEHLDYHLSYSEYLKAKVSLLNKAKIVVLNQDDQSYNTVVTLLKKHIKQIAYSHNEIISKEMQTAIMQRFPESYNQMNARMVVRIAQEMQIANKDIIQAITTFPGVPGRMQYIPNTKHLTVIVDFAHTSQGLRSLLTAAKEKVKPGKKLIVVFGCPGLRDVGKRPLMGRAGAEVADLAIFTADDPRTENIWSIFRQMKEGISTGHGHIMTIPDRQKAIYFAIHHLAKPGDTVVLAGKGHEKSLAYGNDKEYPWDDVLVATSALTDAPPPYSWYQEEVARE